MKLKIRSRSLLLSGDGSVRKFEKMIDIAAALGLDLQILTPHIEGGVDVTLR